LKREVIDNPSFFRRTSLALSEPSSVYTEPDQVPGVGVPRNRIMENYINHIPIYKKPQNIKLLNELPL